MQHFFPRRRIKEVVKNPMTFGPISVLFCIVKYINVLHIGSTTCPATAVGVSHRQKASTQFFLCQLPDPSISIGIKKTEYL